jgi:hypothetical protein
MLKYPNKYLANKAQVAAPSVAFFTAQRGKEGRHRNANMK